MMYLWTASETKPHMQHRFSVYRRCRFILVLVLLTDTVSPHKVIERTEGDSVNLPCRYTGVTLDGRHLTVHWRHNDTRNVYDIIHGEVSLKEQNPAYRDRALVLPEECEKGNFFLKLRDLQLSDGGMYLCFVPDVRIFQSTELVVKENSFKEYKAQRLSEVRSHGSEIRLGWTLHLLIFLLYNISFSLI